MSFRKVLIANRGEIACRIATVLRERGVASVAVHSEADAGSPHARAADEAVLIGPPPVAQSYLQQQAIIDAAGAGIGPLAGQMVEDATNNGTLYQRLGGKEAIVAVIDGLVTAIVADAKLVTFFTMADVARVKTCLVRQVCAVAGGPCAFGSEVDAGEIEPGVGAMNVCLTDMRAVHKPLLDAAGGPITAADFFALAGHLIDVMAGAGVAEADINTTIGAIAATCPDIVSDAEEVNCAPMDPPAPASMMP